MNRASLIKTIMVQACPARRFPDRGRFPRLPRSGAANPPNDIPDIVRHQQRAGPVEGDPHRASHGVPIFLDEAGQHIDRLARRHSAREWDEDHFVAASRFPIPRSVLPNEHPVVESCGQ